MSNEIVIKSYKIRIYPNEKQIKIINQTLGTCRWIYNDYLAINKDNFKNNKPFMSGYEYSKNLTEWKKNDSKYMWLNEISSKAIHESFMDCDEAFKKFFKKKAGFPKFKSKKRNPVRGYYFITDTIKFKHNYINLPILKWTKISENDYIPTIGVKYCGGTLTKDIDNRYYITIRVYHNFNDLYQGKYYNTTNGIGIDVGIKSYITIYDKEKITHICSFLKDDTIKKYEQKIVKLQNIISKKMEINYSKLLYTYLDKYHGEQPDDKTKNIMKEESYSNECIKLQHKINRYKKKIHNYKKDKIDKLVMHLMRTKPRYITIEDLSVKNLLENNASKKLHKLIQDSMFRYFYTKLILNSKFYDIEMRQADKFFASSKKCSCCHYKNKNLTLSNRIFICPKCGFTIDRDENAAINLCKLKKYTILTA